MLKISLVFNLIMIQNALHFTQMHTKSQFNQSIVAGQIHYPRIPPEYWEHRLKMVKSMGFNSISVYVMWNYHEVSKGVFDFQTYNKNLTHFLELAQKYQFKVLIRPGPFVCAQWDHGGLPARLLAIPHLILRANNKQFLSEVRIYFQALTQIIKPFLPVNRGPIIMLQIQNQYGTVGSDITYIDEIRNIWNDLGVNCTQYYVQQAIFLNNKSHWQGAVIGINGAKSEKDFQRARKIDKNAFLFGGQIYSGWMTHWGQKWARKTLSKFTQEFTFLLSNNYSFSMYMAHGGTNFGLTAGAHPIFGIFGLGYLGHITSYDYDAPINEQGAPTSKFWTFRNLVSTYRGWSILQVPDPLPLIEISSFKPKVIANLFANLPQKAYSESQKYFLFQSEQLQMFNQGLVLYQTTIQKGNYAFHVEIRDFAILLIDGKLLKVLDRSNLINPKINITCLNNICKISLLVEAMGHINLLRPTSNDRKGLMSFQGNYTGLSWDIYKINIDESILKWSNYSSQTIPYPTLFHAQISLNTTGDTFLDLSQYKKGYVWVNGRNLGRYWNKGPQRRLFCPGVWLQEGINDIYILEILTDQPGIISGKANGGNTSNY